MKTQLILSALGALAAGAQTITSIQQNGNQYILSWDGDERFVVQTNATANPLGWQDAISATTSPVELTLDADHMMFRLRHDAPTFLWNGRQYDLSFLNNWDLGTNVESYVHNDKDYSWYFSQLDGSPCQFNNCGPAVTAMTMKWYDANSTNTPVSLRADQPVSCGWWSTGNIALALANAGIRTYMLPYTTANLTNMINRGDNVILCLNAAYLPQYPDPARHGLYYGPDTGHFIIVKGYRVTDTGLWLEVYDSVGTYWYSDGTCKGTDRSHDEMSLYLAACNWWPNLIDVPPPGGKSPLNALDKTKVPLGYGQ